MTSERAKKLLILILVASAILRFGWLSRGDTVNDEVYYGFRAIGLTDFTASIQTTPLEWWDPTPPWWTHLSFHDHPPLVFWVEYISLAIFGENNFGMRFPSALFGVASVFVLFLLGKRLFGEEAGLVASALLSCTLGAVYISRVGIQESMVIFFLVATSYAFLRALEEERFFVVTGVLLGLALLTKYSAIVLVPIFLVYLFVYARRQFQNKHLWLGAVCMSVIISPVLIYNILLFQATGHFDLQISYIVGNYPEAWSGALGKEVGTFSERLHIFFPRLIASHSWLFLSVAFLSLFFLRNVFVALTLGFLTVLLLIIGPSTRFLEMLTPFLAFSIGALFQRRRYMFYLLIPFLLFELFYSVNNQLAYYPVGTRPWLASDIRYENYNWGYNALGDYLRKEFEKKVPAIVFDAPYAFIRNAQDRSIERGKKRGYAPYPALVVVYGNIDRGAKLWTLDRLNLYHGWPIIDMRTYMSYREQQGLTYFEDSGFTSLYFVQSTNIVPDPEFRSLVEGLPYTSIVNPRDEEVFRVYRK